MYVFPFIQFRIDDERRAVIIYRVIKNRAGQSLPPPPATDPCYAPATYPIYLFCYANQTPFLGLSILACHIWDHNTNVRYVLDLAEVVDAYIKDMANYS